MDEDEIVRAGWGGEVEVNSRVKDFSFLAYECRPAGVRFVRVQRLES